MKLIENGLVLNMENHFKKSKGLMATRHHIMDYGTVKFTCQKCFKGLNRRDSLKYHYVKCKGPKERSCKIRSKQFPYHCHLKSQFCKSGAI